MINTRPKKSNCIGVTSFTRIEGYDVPGMHRRGHYPAAFGMTSGTISRRALKHASRMARSALGVTVRTRQGKTRFNMAKIERCRLRRCVEHVGMGECGK
jgi:hypothetical protein